MRREPMEAHAVPMPPCAADRHVACRTDRGRRHEQHELRLGVLVPDAAHHLQQLRAGDRLVGDDEVAGHGGLPWTSLVRVWRQDPTRHDAGKGAHFGAGGRTRTDDLPLTTPLLYQLSYTGGHR